jgi:hypothetical protein
MAHRLTTTAKSSLSSVSFDLFLSLSNRRRLFFVTCSRTHLCAAPQNQHAQNNPRRGIKVHERRAAVDRNSFYKRNSNYIYRINTETAFSNFELSSEGRYLHLLDLGYTFSGIATADK